MKSRKIVAGLIGAAAIATMGIAAPTANASTPSILQIVASSSPAPGVVDNNGRDFDILYFAVDALGLGSAVAGLQNATVFAPADNSFRGLVADLTNKPIWQVSEQTVKDTLLALVGVGQAETLKQVVLFHVSSSKDGNTFNMSNTVGQKTITPKPFFFTWVLPDGDPTDRIDPFTVGKVNASNGTVYPIAGVLRPIDFNALNGVLGIDD